MARTPRRRAASKHKTTRCRPPPAHPVLKPYDKTTTAFFSQRVALTTTFSPHSASTNSSRHSMPLAAVPGRAPRHLVTMLPAAVPTMRAASCSLHLPSSAAVASSALSSAAALPSPQALGSSAAASAGREGGGGGVCVCVLRRRGGDCVVGVVDPAKKNVERSVAAIDACCLLLLLLRANEKDAPDRRSPSRPLHPHPCRSSSHRTPRRKGHPR